MNVHLLEVNSVVFFFLMFIWSTKSWVNLFLKLGFLILGIVNLAVVFGVKL